MANNYTFIPQIDFPDDNSTKNLISLLYYAAERISWLGDIAKKAKLNMSWFAWVIYEVLYVSNR
jgi:hypothetical protein